MPSHYKHYYAVRGGATSLFAVVQCLFNRYHIESNTTNNKWSDFDAGEGANNFAAAECVTRWNTSGASRFYLVRENAEEQAANLNGKKKPLVSIAILPKKEPMKNGEIKRLPKANAPAFCEQWAVQGTGKAPYVVTRRQNYDAGIQIWQCSCPNWTQHTPRTDCKHIVAVKKKEGILVETTAAMLPKDQQKLFEAFLKQQAEAGTPALKVDAKPLNLFSKTGRRFR